MHRDKWIRQTHRWLSVTFTVTVLVTSVALALQVAVDWIVYLPLPPLFLLLASGLYLFVLPYVLKRRSVGAG
ncbi:hypothetical protein JOF56_005970 [Kibdelosporangium banguiense]|uniref:Uncharacterized protein n=1 Tax=Kibdelosporangium banguiense TaxID=1365924 RepID=A0ABS4TME2_9PSEU|nr:hypothetical protein [Kibdelosporangium banguiense]MBP2325585.1 hypothetical protein [Kibdelosporangium banguiense]